MGYALKKQAYDFGKNAESIACSFLEKNGYTPVARRFKTSHGEIDLIMKNIHNQYIFVEVKARKTHKEATYSITTRQQKRILLAALAFMQTCDSFLTARFDAIWVSEEEGRYQITHIPGAFDGSLSEDA